MQFISTVPHTHSGTKLNWLFFCPRSIVQLPKRPRSRKGSGPCSKEAAWPNGHLLLNNKPFCTFSLHWLGAWVWFNQLISIGTWRGLTIAYIGRRPIGKEPVQGCGGKGITFFIKGRWHRPQWQPHLHRGAICGQVCRNNDSSSVFSISRETVITAKPIKTIRLVHLDLRNWIQYSRLTQSTDQLGILASWFGATVVSPSVKG